MASSFSLGFSRPMKPCYTLHDEKNEQGSWCTIIWTVHSEGTGLMGVLCFHCIDSPIYEKSASAFSCSGRVCFLWSCVTSPTTHFSRPVSHWKLPSTHHHFLSPLILHRHLPPISHTSLLPSCYNCSNHCSTININDCL